MVKSQRYFCQSLAVMASATGASVAADSGYDQFIGDWELVAYVVFSRDSQDEDKDKDKDKHKEMNYVGYLSYDEHGNMAALGMPQNLPDQLRENEQARAGFAYWGTVSVDAEEKIVTHHVKGSPTQPRWVGGDNVRHYEFEGNFLKLSLQDESGRTAATLTWRRLP